MDCEVTGDGVMTLPRASLVLSRDMVRVVVALTMRLVCDSPIVMLLHVAVVSSTANNHDNIFIPNNNE